MHCPELFGEATGEMELKFRQAWLLMAVLFPNLSDATAGSRAPLHALYRDKMSSSHIPEELVKRVSLADSPAFGWERSASEVSSITGTPGKVVPDDLLKMTKVTNDWQK